MWHLPEVRLQTLRLAHATNPVTTVDHPKLSLQRLHYGGYEASISRVYFKAFRTQGIRWLSRNGPCADQTQFFSHLHRPPRREPSNISPRQFIDSDWQWRRCGWLVRHALSWHGRNRYRIGCLPSYFWGCARRSRQ